MVDSATRLESRNIAKTEPLLYILAALLSSESVTETGSVFQFQNVLKSNAVVDANPGGSLGDWNSRTRKSRLK